MRAACLAILPMLILSFVHAEWAHAQDSEFRRTYTFFGDHLPVEVFGTPGGQLLVMRGGRGRLEVAARARRSVLSAAPPREPGAPLRLGAAGAGWTEWVVVVPEHVHVTVRVPGRDAAVPASTAAAAVYEWAAADHTDRRSRRVRGASPARDHQGLAAIYADAVTPASVDVGALAAIRRIGLRLEGEEFAIAASGATALRRPDAASLRIRATGPPADLVFTIPPATRSFTLMAVGRIIAMVRDGEIHTTCSPVTLQTLASGTRTADFTPLRGMLECGP